MIEELNTEFRIVDQSGKPWAGIPKKTLAKYLVEATMTGMVTLVTGEVIQMSVEQLQKLWFDMMNRVDGPPAQEIDANVSNPILFDAIPTIQDDDGNDQLERTVPADSETEGSSTSDQAQ